MAIEDAIAMAGASADANSTSIADAGVRANAREVMPVVGDARSAESGG